MSSIKRIQNALTAILNRYFRPHLHAWTLFFIFAFAECIVNPIAEFPLNDDWAYTKSVWLLQFENMFTIGDWPAMTLFSHIIWGFVFTKLFGFSFFVLRFSTLISALTGVLVLNKLVTKISGNKSLGFSAALVLMLNPIYFNLSNTYMTDVNFNTLLLLDCLLIYTFFENRKPKMLIWIFLVSSLLMLIRQFGLIVPMAFVMACFFLQEKKYFFSGAAIFICILVVLLLKLYEGNLENILPEKAAYKFTGEMDLTGSDFWEKFVNLLGLRSRIVLLQAMVFITPFSILFLPSQIFGTKRLNLLIMSALIGGGVFVIFRYEKFFLGNVFLNMSLGPELFYQNSQSGLQHNYSPVFQNCIEGIKVLFPSLFILGFILFLRKRKHNPVIGSHRNPFVVFVFCLTLMYLGELFIFDSLFDRYILPLVSMGLILISFYAKGFIPRPKWMLVTTPLLFYVSVFGTKDYFAFNTKRWEAYRFLRNEKQVSMAEMNGGFEINCWDDGKITWWQDYTTLNGYNYLIQYDQPAHFKLLKEYQFQRYFPYKIDKINIFVRDSLD